MKMDRTADLAPDIPAASPEVFRQLDAITRQLHADGLPDARSRLTYIAAKTGEAADKLPSSVEQAKAGHASSAAPTRGIAVAIVANVVSLAADLEDGLVKLLVRAAPQEVAKVRTGVLHGPVLEPTGRDDIVANQREVDDLLASLVF